MLYYIKSMQLKLYISKYKANAWFASDDNAEYYVVRYLRNKYHIWDVSYNPICLCCGKGKWTMKVDWNPA